jgi:endonuclease/exonuclease/phosphatase family metal-dependent hydrolase
MHKFDKVLSCTTWAYLASTALALIFMYLAGDRWWPGTLFLFGPRWVLALPIIPLLPLILWRRPDLLIPLALGAAVVFVPFMGFRYSFSTPQTVGKGAIRVLSCNVGGNNFDAQKLSRLIQDLDVDIVSLQECPRSLQLDLAAEWHVLRSGSLSVLSRYPLKNLPPVKGIPVPGTWPLYPLFPCIAATPCGDILVYAVHLPTARYGLENMLDRTVGLNFKKAGYLIAETQKRSHISQAARNAVETQKLPLVIAGDFNMPVESSIYRQHWGEFRNAFSCSGGGFGFTSMDIHKGIPIPIRIDHILTGKGVTPRACEIGPDVGSDHRPVIAEVGIQME